MSCYYTSDLHIAHNSINKYRTEFKSAKEHHEFMINKILSLNKRDTLYILGDFIFDSPDYEYYIGQIRQTKAQLKIVLGNHDSRNLYRETSPNISIQLPLFSYKNMWVSHCPIHPQEMRGKDLNLHGHIHKNVLDDKRYFNVNIDVNNYEFVKVEDIKAYRDSLGEV